MPLLHEELRELRGEVSVPIVLVTHDRLSPPTLQAGRTADVMTAPADGRVRHALNVGMEEAA